MVPVFLRAGLEVVFAKHTDVLPNLVGAINSRKITDLTAAAFWLMGAERPRHIRHPTTDLRRTDRPSIEHNKVSQGIAEKMADFDRDNSDEDTSVVEAAEPSVVQDRMPQARVKRLIRQARLKKQFPPQIVCPESDHLCNLASSLFDLPVFVWVPECLKGRAKASWCKYWMLMCASSKGV